jgi:hypothetical protein
MELAIGPARRRSLRQGPLAAFLGAHTRRPSRQLGLAPEPVAHPALAQVAAEERDPSLLDPGVDLDR